MRNGLKVEAPGRSGADDAGVVPRRFPVLAVAIVGGRDLLSGPRGRARQASEAGWRSLLFKFWSRGSGSQARMVVGHKGSYLL